MASVCGFKAFRKAEGVAEFRNFSFILAKAEYNEVFNSGPVLNIEGAQFGIALYPAGLTDGAGDNHSMALKISCESVAPLHCKFRYCFMNGEESVHERRSALPREFHKSSRWGHNKLEAYKHDTYPTHDELKGSYKSRLQAFQEKGWIKDDVLTVKLFIEAVVGEYTCLRADAALQPTEGAVHVLSDLRRLLEDGTGSDVKLVSSDGSVSAHRIILAMRSPVFRAMLSTEMAEARSGEIVFHDIDSSSLRNFLHYLYCGTLADGINDGELWVLMRLGHQYEVLPLVEECSARLQKELTTDTAATMLLEADKFGISSMKKCALDFITSTTCVFKKVRESQGYQALPAVLLDEILASTFGLGKRSRDNSEYEYPDGSSWSTLKLASLRRALTERGLSASGVKAELVTRLQQAEGS